MFKKFLDKYLEYLHFERNMAAMTIVSYKKDLNSFFEYLEKKSIIDVDRSIVRRYMGHLKNLGLTKRSIARALSSLKSFFRYLEIHKLYNKNPVSLIHIPKIEKYIPSFLTYNEIVEFLDNINGDDFLGVRNKALFELLYNTGTRVSEIANLKIENISLKERYIKVFGKGRKERVLPIGEMAASKLQDYFLEREKFLVKRERSYEANCFVNKNGGPLTDRGIRKILTNYIKKMSFTKKISPHTIRHTFATHLLDNGCDIRSVQELLGHSSLNTTQIYTHVTKKKLKEVYGVAHPHAKGDLI